MTRAREIILAVCAMPLGIAVLLFVLALLSTFGRAP